MSPLVGLVQFPLCSSSLENSRVSSSFACFSTLHWLEDDSVFQVPIWITKHCTSTFILFHLRCWMKEKVWGVGGAGGGPVWGAGRAGGGPVWGVGGAGGGPVWGVGGAGGGPASWWCTTFQLCHQPNLHARPWLPGRTGAGSCVGGARRTLSTVYVRRYVHTYSWPGHWLRWCAGKNEGGWKVSTIVFFRSTELEGLRIYLRQEICCLVVLYIYIYIYNKNRCAMDVGEVGVATL